MTSLVLDASVALCWCFENQATEYTEGVFERLAAGAEAHVPFIWPVEMMNALVLAERRTHITPARVTALLEEITQWPIHVDRDGVDRAFQETLALARQYRITAYDATYLELAVRKALPLATLHNNLGKAARAAGVESVRPWP